MTSSSLVDRVVFEAHDATPSCPCVVVADVSGSMAGAKMAELNAGLAAFARDVLSDDLAAQRLEMMLMTVSDAATVHTAWTSVSSFQPPTLMAGGRTALCGGIIQALDEIERHKRKLRADERVYYRPYMLVLTDGEPTDPELMDEAVRRVHEAELRRQAIVWMVGVGDGVNMATLRRLSQREPLRLEAEDLKGLFQFLSASISATTSVQPGQQVTLPSSWTRE